MRRDGALLACDACRQLGSTGDGRMLEVERSIKFGFPLETKRLPLRLPLETKCLSLVKMDLPLEQKEVEKKQYRQVKKKEEVDLGEFEETEETVGQEV